MIYSSEILQDRFAGGKTGATLIRETCCRQMKVHICLTRGKGSGSRLTGCE